MIDNVMMNETLAKGFVQRLGLGEEAEISLPDCAIQAGKH